MILRHLLLVVALVSLALSGSARFERPAPDGYEIAFADGFCGDQPAPGDFAAPHCPLCVIASVAAMPDPARLPQRLASPHRITVAWAVTAAPGRPSGSLWPPNRAPPASLSRI